MLTLLGRIVQEDLELVCWVVNDDIEVHDRSSVDCARSPSARCMRRLKCGGPAFLLDLTRKTAKEVENVMEE